MSFYYIEEDGKTCTEYELHDFTAKFGIDAPNDPFHYRRMFAVPADTNTFIDVDPETGRYVYNSGVNEVKF